MKLNKLTIVILVLVVLGTAFLVVFSNLPKFSGHEVKAFHVTDTSPSHQEIFGSSPINIVINTDVEIDQGKFSISGKSKKTPIEISTSVNESKTTLRGLFSEELLPDTYRVNYELTYSNPSHNQQPEYKKQGEFSFTIDSNKKAEYKDLTGQKEVTINMKDLKFDPQKIIISAGTKVTWVNSDSIEHFVNTDPHPSHTYYLDQNSLDIPAKGNYSVTFTQVGEYPYHCSAHYPEGMSGRIIVQ